MNFISKCKIYFYINCIACIYILSTTNYIEPLICDSPSSRILGIFSTRDILTTICIGSGLGYFVNKSIVKGILIEFMIGQFFHLFFMTNTMFLYSINMSNKPDGTGYIPNCINNTVYTKI